MTRPHVLVDGFFLGKPYGFGRFAGELVRALSLHAPDVDVSVAVPEDTAWVSEGTPEHVTLHRLPPRNLIVWEQVAIPALARRLGCHVIHFPYNTRAVHTRGLPSVTTVHDLVFLEPDAAAGLTPKERVAFGYARWAFKYATLRSEAVVSVSETTARLLDERGVASSVVYNTVDGFAASLPERPAGGSGRRYVLHRGGTAAHRNTGRVIEAFRQVRREHPDVDLKVIGVPDGAAVWDVGPDEGITFLPRQTDAELAALYADSACVLATSLEEGFGLPIIEGFVFGAPVVTSDRDPMREVAGGAARLVDPTEADEIADALGGVLADPSLAAALRARGAERYRDFTAEQVAGRMREVYREVAAAP
ncbi:glycosyltransferase family 4 protein [Geodermatophilus nigrescens]|uniref:Glycosyltransferase involved in cell wall bisynthesis n=1 Tax=Geodermatophilus nigrescens TaxID=1070870 RepID=A0A1M5D6Y2_9ACTN|nr:glycosyltransferase family 1 protein [Geodermatophilus nigrescens]SHF62701.1 Glycosyltransferase involved in cell wall bisynthesis [Geodermatophilus nigrescens]